jgi:hypothetical protein
VAGLQKLAEASLDGPCCGISPVGSSAQNVALSRARPRLGQGVPCAHQQPAVHPGRVREATALGLQGDALTDLGNDVVAELNEVKRVHT